MDQIHKILGKVRNPSTGTKDYSLEARYTHVMATCLTVRA